MTSSSDVRYFLSTLKRLDSKSRALASHPELTLRLLFQSMTTGERVEAIGHLAKMNDYVGDLYVQCLRINQSGRSSRMDSTTLPSSGEHMEYAQWADRMTRCSSTTRSNRNRS